MEAGILEIQSPTMVLLRNYFLFKFFQLEKYVTNVIIELSRNGLQ